MNRLTLMLRLAIQARRAKMHRSTSRIVGLTGRVETPIAPDGTIFVRGELWPAHAPVVISRGETARVIGVIGLTLNVIPIEPIGDNAV
jgi:membrane-bound serine protease (ClpP class)